jgi:hypothetical protein
MPKPVHEYAEVALPELEGLTLNQTLALLANFRTTAAQLRALFAFPLTRYTTEERPQQAAAASFRHGEEAAFHSVLDAIDAAPQLVASLNDKDQGVDDSSFETDLLRSRVEVAKLFAQMSEELSQLSQDLRDTSFELGCLARPSASHAYGILKSAAQHDARVRALLSTAIDFYRASSRRRAPEK